MKKILLFSFFTASAFGLNAQEKDSVSVEAGYANQTYYSFKTGTVASVPSNSWDIAFDASNFGSAIRINGTKHEVYVSGSDTTNFGNPLDTTGFSANWDSYVNSDTSWAMGAFNAPADPSNATDLGWGIYSTITHGIKGDRVFLLKDIASGECVKFWVKLLIGGEYTFRIATLDNSSDDTYTIAKDDYTKKNFAYFDLSTGVSSDLEPSNEEWDILFTKYITMLQPGVNYAVTGALLNPKAKSQKIEDVPTSKATFVASDFSEKTNGIGWNWKKLDPSFRYYTEDSTTFFVESFTGDTWKLDFSGFAGSSTGKIYFNKERIGAASIFETASNYSVYPNPANSQINVTSQNGFPISTILIYDLTGRIVYEENLNQAEGVQTILTDLLINGNYLFQIVDVNGNSTVEKIQIFH